MPIYFPRGFNSGEALRIVDGVTVIAGKLAKAKTDLVIVAVVRGPLGGIGGPVARQAKRVLAAAGSRTASALRALPREPGAIHLLPRGQLPARRLGVLELDAPPRSAIERMRLVAQILDCALVAGARELAIGPFDAGEDGARLTLDALRKGLPAQVAATPEPDATGNAAPRVMLLLPDPRVFRAVVGDQKGR